MILALALCCFVDIAQDLEGFIQPDGINVEQADVKSAKLRGENTVADDIAGKYSAARTDKGDFQASHSFLRDAFILLQTDGNNYRGMLSPLDFMLHFSYFVVC